MSKTNWVYILKNKPFGRFYVGSTSYPEARLNEHRTGKGSKHVAKYGLHQLVWFKAFDTLDEALEAEHRIKRWKRETKFDAILKMNPDWRDLTSDILADAALESGPGTSPGTREVV